MESKATTESFTWFFLSHVGVSKYISMKNWWISNAKQYSINRNILPMYDVRNKRKYQKNKNNLWKCNYLSTYVSSGLTISVFIKIKLRRI